MSEKYINSGLSFCIKFKMDVSGIFANCSNYNFKKKNSFSKINFFFGYKMKHKLNFIMCKKIKKNFYSQPKNKKTDHIYTKIKQALLNFIKKKTFKSTKKCKY